MAKGKSEAKEPKESKPRTKAAGAEFRLEMPEATAVFLAGDFNQWGTEEVKMKMDKKGVWKAKVKLVPGTYQYKFVVDGKWIEDPSNTHTLADPFGGRNSVVVVE